MSKQFATSVSMKKFDWNYLGFGLCRMWITQWMLLPVTMLDNWKLSVEMLYFLPGAIACFCLAFLIRDKGDRRTRTLTLLASALLSLAGVAFISGGALGNSVALLVPGFVFAGIGAALLQTLWGDKFACLPTEQANLYTICALLLSALLSLVARSAASMASALLLFAAVPFGSYILLYRGFKSGDWDVALSGVRVERTDDRRSVISLGRLCVSIFVFVFVYNFAYSTVFPSPAVLLSGPSIRTMSNVCVMAVLLIVLFRTGKLNRMGLYRMSFPILIGALLLSLVVPGEYAAAALTAAAVGYKLFDVLFWCVLVGMAHDSRGSTWKVFGSGMAANLSGMALGMGGKWVFDIVPACDSLDYTVIVCVLMFALVVVVILILPESFIAQFLSHGVRGANGFAEGSLAEKCDAAARAFFLTTREREVLGLLAQGRTQGVIAKKLGIGEGTAHTHIVHIYQKMGIHSQQELIDAIEGISLE